MQTHRLQPHPQSPALAVRAVTVHFVPRLPDGKAMLRVRVEGNDQLIVPEFKGRGRQDELWKTTCFELFLRRADGSYREFNFSPSGRWAAYDFSSYRAGMTGYEPLSWPDISDDAGTDLHVAAIFFDTRELLGFETAALTAVIEETGGQKSYWSVAHGNNQPDFHDPACFAVPLGAAKDT